jgi:uncharacterized membrane protein
MTRNISTGRCETRGDRARVAVLGVALAATVFAAGTFLAPALTGTGNGWGGALRLLYAPVCHQAPERSLSLGGNPQAVCARCSGLYLGGVAGIVAGALLFAGTGRAPRRRWLVVALVPTALDTLAPWVGLGQLSNGPRLISALPAGALLGMFLAVAVADLCRSPSNVTHFVEETDG